MLAITHNEPADRPGLSVVRRDLFFPNIVRKCFDQRTKGAHAVPQSIESRFHEYPTSEGQGSQFGAIVKREAKTGQWVAFVVIVGEPWNTSEDMSKNICRLKAWMHRDAVVCSE